MSDSKEVKTDATGTSVHGVVMRFLDRLSMEGGQIVCTASLDVPAIEKARQEDRMFVLGSGIGFVFVPPISVDEQLRIIANAPISKEFVKLRAERDSCRSVCKMLVAFDEMSDDEDEYMKNSGAMIEDIIELARAAIKSA